MYLIISDAPYSATILATISPYLDTLFIKILAFISLSLGTSLVSVTLTSNVWLFSAPIESVKLICIVYFPALSELTGLILYLKEFESKVMNEGRI